jgi:GNAT superfamily N-acetyltransferase
MTDLVRDATVADAPAVAAVGRASFLRQYEGLVDPANYAWAVDVWYGPAAVAGSIERAGLDPRARFLVAERDGAVIGFLDYDERGPEPELHRLYVDADARGGGAGGALIDSLHEWLEPGHGYVLGVVEGNDAAQRFYLRHGLESSELVSAHDYYLRTAGTVFPGDAEDFRLQLLRYPA